ncbi:MAG: phenylacetate--CoA ligase family protein [bacterium]
MRERAARLFNDWVLEHRGWDYRPTLRELERLQWEPPQVVREWRLGRLRDLLEHCSANVPYYSARMTDAGIEPREVNGIEDLADLPIVDKTVLREDYSRFFATRGGRETEEWVTSGATGQPFAFRLDRASIGANTFAALARGRRWWDADFGRREAMIWSGVRDVSGGLAGMVAARRRQLSWRLKNIMLFDIYSLDEVAVERIYRKLARFRPPVMRVISSGLYRFCAVLDDLGLDGRALGVQVAIYTGEAFPPAQRELVERVLGCRTVCEYGCGELGIIAFECPEGGLHLTHENMFFEFVRDGRPAKPGETAELVVTNLNGYSAPLLRYRVGDVVVPSDHDCACGRAMPLIESVGGRSHDTIRTPDGGTIHALFFTHLFDLIPIVHQFRVVQRAVDRIRVELVSTEAIPDDVREFIRTSVEKEMGGGGASAEVVQIAEIPRNRGGKAAWIVSEIDAQ